MALVRQLIAEKCILNVKVIILEGSIVSATQLFVVLSVEPFLHLGNLVQLFVKHPVGSVNARADGPRIIIHGAYPTDLCGFDTLCVDQGAVTQSIKIIAAHSHALQTLFQEGAPDAPTPIARMCPRGAEAQSPRHVVGSKGDAATGLDGYK